MRLKCSLPPSSNMICKSEVREKERALPLVGQCYIPGLLLHQEEATGLHEYGKAHVEDDGDQQWRRDELARRMIRCQLWIGFSQTHWRETRGIP